MQHLSWAAVAVALVLANTSTTRAQDTLRLDGNGDAKPPCVAEVATLPRATVLSSSTSTQPPIFQKPLPPSSFRPQLPNPDRTGDGTLFYDGGPGQPMPLPSQEGPAPTFQKKRSTVPLEGRLVSLPRPASKYVYPAYGDPIPAAKPATTTPVRVNPSPGARTTPIAYGAYGAR